MTEATAESVTVSTWPVWELVNPSDPYTFRAPDVRVATVAAFMLSPAYGAKRVDGEERSPLVTGWDEFVVKHGIDEVWMDSHLYEIAEAFDSFLIGSPSERADAEAALSLLANPREVRKWKLQRQDRLRTSLSAIGESAYSYADQMRRNLKEMTIEAAKS